MDIQLLFKPLAQFEQKVADLYEWFSGLFKDDSEAGFVFYRLSSEEISHVALIEYQRRLVRQNPDLFASVDVDLCELEQTTTTVDEIRRAAPPSLEEAIRSAVRLESSAAECHFRNAIKQANPSISRLLESLGSGDRQHAAALTAFARRRGFIDPVG